MNTFLNTHFCDFETFGPHSHLIHIKVKFLDYLIEWWKLNNTIIVRLISSTLPIILEDKPYNHIIGSSNEVQHLVNIDLEIVKCGLILFKYVLNSNMLNLVMFESIG